MCSSMCEMPIFSGLSWSEAARTHAPNATDRTPGIDSESTVRPFATLRRWAVWPASALTALALTTGADRCHRGTAARANPFAARLCLAFGLGSQCLHREAEASALVALEQLDLDAVSFLDHVLR